MGADVTTQKTDTQATPQEEELNEILLNRTRATDKAMTEVQSNSLSLVNSLLTGQDLPGYLGTLPGGIDESTIGNIVKNSIEDVGSYTNYLGITDSGQAKELGVSTASDIRTNAKQFNLQNLMQLLNIAVGGQATAQSPIMGQTGMLSQNLAGLRSSNTSVSQTNPFLKSLQTSAGEGLGNVVNPQTWWAPKK